MKNILKVAVLALLVLSCKEAKKDESTQREVVADMEMTNADEEWTMIFDGKTFDGWHEYLKQDVSDNWKIEDGAMVLYPPETNENGEQFNLVTDDTFTDFVLSLDWRISEAGNSGVMWGVKEIEDLGQPYLHWA